MASIVSLCAFVVYTFCFAAILVAGTPYSWTDISGLAAHEAANPVGYKYTGMGCMLVFVSAFVVMAACMKPKGANGKADLLYRLAFAFSTAFCVVVSVNYFVQISATRLQLQQGLTAGLEQFTQTFSISAINAINMLGWTLFYPLATGALSFLFPGGAPGRAAKSFCWLNTAMMLAGLVGYVCNSYPVLLVTMNAGLGATSMGLIVTMGLWFKRCLRTPEAE